MIERQVIRYGLQILVQNTVIVNRANDVERNLHLTRCQVLLTQLLVKYVVERSGIGQRDIGHLAASSLRTLVPVVIIVTPVITVVVR